MNQRKIFYPKARLSMFGILLVSFAFWGTTWIIEPIFQNHNLLHNIHRGSWRLLELAYLTFVITNGTAILRELADRRQRESEQ